jgi:hypothetical protein
MSFDPNQGTPNISEAPSPPPPPPVVSRRPSRIPEQATGPGSAIGLASMAGVAAWAIEDPTIRAGMTLVVAIVIYLMGRFRGTLPKAR